MQFPQHITPSQVSSLPSLSWRGWPFPNMLLGFEELSSAPLLPCPSVPGLQVLLAQGTGQGLLVLGGVVGEGATWPFHSAPGDSLHRAFACKEVAHHGDKGRSHILMGDPRRIFQMRLSLCAQTLL